MSSTRPASPRAPATDPRRAGLLICAHGRDGGPGIAETHAAALAARGAVAEARACCLKGRPTVAEALAALSADRILLVPLLMEEGYTARTRLPDALDAAGAAGSRLRVAPPLGTAPELAALLGARAEAACAARGWTPAETALLVVGHGTPRDPRSGAVLDGQVARLTATGAFAHVGAAFLERPPTVAQAVAALPAGPCVAVGFFADAGSHGEADVPRLLAEAAPDAAYAGPVGTDPAITDLILALARNAPA